MRILMAIATNSFGVTRRRASFKIVKHLIVHNGYGHMLMLFALFLSIDVLADRQGPWMIANICVRKDWMRMGLFIFTNNIPVLPLQFRNFPVLMSQNTLSVFLVTQKMSLVWWTVSPMVHSIPMFQVVLVLSLINVSICSSRTPYSFTISHSVFELTFVDWSVTPTVPPSALKFSSHVWTLVFITIFEDLRPMAVLQSLLESSLIVLSLSQDQFSKTVFSALFPLSAITNAVFIELPSFAVLDAIDKLPHVYWCLLWTIRNFKHACSTTLAVPELSLIDKFSRLVLYSFTWFFTLSVHELAPSSEINSALIVQ